MLKRLLQNVEAIVRALVVVRDDKSDDSEDLN